MAHSESVSLSWRLNWQLQSESMRRFHNRSCCKSKSTLPSSKLSLQQQSDSMSLRLSLQQQFKRVTRFRKRAYSKDASLSLKPS
jgi:hypothetical protein